MKKLLGLLAIAIAGAAGYLAITPSPIDPLAWQPQPAPLMTGVLEPNDTLMKAELLAQGQIHGPEDTAVDAQGRVYAGLHDGRVVRIADGKVETFANTGGRPLGMDFDAQGNLVTQSGLQVMGDGGPINIPPNTQPSIAPDGTVSAVPRYGTPNNVNVVGRIKLVNPAENELVRGDDGLFRTRNREPAPLDENVKLASEALEGSNVNPVDAMVNLISLARQFEMQVKMLQTADTNAQRADQLLSLNA